MKKYSSLMFNIFVILLFLLNIGKGNGSDKECKECREHKKDKDNKECKECREHEKDKDNK